MNTNLTLNTSKIRGYKNKILAISLIAIFAMSIVMTFAPTTSAQVGITQPRTTAGYITAAPTVVGVGQHATINLWVLPWPQAYSTVSYYGGPNGGSYTGISVTFTRPDGTKDTFTPTDAINVYPAGVLDGLGTMFFYYAPNMAGNWSVTMSMPAQNFTDSSGTVQWKGCTSQPAYFTVTTEAQNAGILNGWPYSPLPNSNTYWTLPVSSNNREWASISGEFLGYGTAPVGGFYQPYGTGTSTGHVLWTQNYAPGGLVGGSWSSISYEVPGTTTMAILSGKLFVNTADSLAFECIDLTTGKILWTAPGGFTCALHLPGNALTQAVASASNPAGANVVLESSYGATPTTYLFQASGSTWNYYNIISGAKALTYSNVTVTGYAPIDGTNIVYGYTNGGYNLTTGIFATNYVWMWNLTKVTGGNWQTGIQWKTNCTGTPQNPGPGDGAARPNFVVSADLTAMMYGDGPAGNIVRGFDTATGKSIYNVTLPYTGETSGLERIMFGSNNWINFDGITSTYNCYSILTGQLIWSSPNAGNSPWNTKALIHGVADATQYYIPNPDGSVTALSLADGKQLWTSAPIPSNEYTTNGESIWYDGLVVGGYLYTYAGYSKAYEINPIPRFAVMLCLNTTTGKTVFTLNGGVFPWAATGGYIFGASRFDGDLYCIGKGQTATTVLAPNNFVEGATVQIQGSVMDMSPAQPNTPAVADSAMSEWMDYLHMQNATLLNNPPQETGVPVTLTAVDPNNNTVTIGTTTTNSKGDFYYSWKPTVSGAYTITASFAGSGSYWPSSGQTGALVNPLSSATSTPGQTTTASGVSDTALYTVGAVLAIVIVIGFVVSILLQRKRP